VLRKISDKREERAWLDRCAEGDDVPFGGSYTVIETVCASWRTRAAQSAEAEDVAQEAFVKAFRLIGQFSGGVRLLCLALRIVINLCLDRMRRKCVTAEMPLEEGVLSSQLVCGPDVEKRLTVAQDTRLADSADARAACAAGG